MPLKRDEVVDGALRLVDEAGLEALTMRQLADALGVQAGAIYWHFANKQELMDAMIAKVMDGLLDAPLRGRWDQQLAELSRRIAAAMARQRDGALLATRALEPAENMLALSERMLAIARDAGFDKDGALAVTSVLGYYVLGWVTDMQATEAAKSRGLQKVLRSIADGIDEQRFPRLAEVGSARALEQLTTARQFRARFEYGLGVILDGLRAALRARRRRRPARTRKSRRR